MITPEIKNFLNQQKLGYVATVSPDGKPNISPKGTIIGWTDCMLVFAHIRSPDTINNLYDGSDVEINVIDPLLRRGYLFQGMAKIIKDGDLYHEILNHYRDDGIKSPIHSVVLVNVSSVSEVTSPSYDLGMTQQEIKSKWKKHFTSL